MWSFGLLVVIKTAFQVVNGGWIFLNLKWRMMMRQAQVTLKIQNFKSFEENEKSL